MASLGCPSAMPTARATPPMLIIMSPGRLELPWNWMEWRLRHGNQTRRGAHEAANKLRLWLLAASLASRRWCTPIQSNLCYCAICNRHYTSSHNKPGMPEEPCLGTRHVAVGTRQQQRTGRAW